MATWKQVLTTDDLALGTATATSGNLLIGDGTDFESVAMSGEGTISNAGVFALGTLDKLVVDNAGTVGSVGAEDAMTIASNGKVTFVDDIKVAGNNIEGAGGNIFTFSGQNVTMPGNMTITGDLQVSGATITTTTETLEIADNTLILNSDLSGAAVDAGIVFERGSSGDNQIFYHDASENRLAVGTNNEADLTTSPTQQGFVATTENVAGDPTGGSNGSGVGSVWVNTSTNNAWIRVE